MATLDAQARARLPDSAFAYIDSKGRRRLPINDASHVRNALARFDQTTFEDDDARERARQRLLKAAKRYGIVPLGFFDGQLRKERLDAELASRATDPQQLPRGMVTFLFTDIEASTALVRRLGDRYAPLLRAVRTIIRSRVRRFGGAEVDARADEFFAVFAEARRAVETAIDIQRCLAERRWPRGIDVRVRIGVHSGRPKLTETGYVGIAVHTAARVCWAGHGGQILVTSAVRDAVLQDGAAIAMRSLGAHDLPGLEAPEPLFQIDADGLRSTFPALRRAAPATA